MRRGTFCVALAGCLSACSSAQYRRAPNNALEKAFQFTEVTESRERIRIEGVPDLTEVDLNSIIEIQINSEKADTSGVAPLQKREAELKEAIAKLGAVIEARTVAVNAYDNTRTVPLNQLAGSKEFEAFTIAASGFGKAEGEFLDLEIWSKAFATTEEQNEALGDPTYAALGNVFQTKLRETEESLKEAAEQARSKANLRLEAFLESPSATPTPIHLEGYDDLANRAIEARGKSAWTMSDTERENLQKQFQAVTQLAKQAERVRRGEERLSGALLSAGKGAFARFPELQRDLSQVLAQDLQNIPNGILESVNEFKIRISSAGQALSADEKLLWLDRLGKFKVDALRAIPAHEFRALATSFGELSEGWETVNPDGLFLLLEKTRKTLGVAESISQTIRRKDLRVAITEIETLTKDLTSRPASITDESWKEIESAATASGLLANANAAQSAIKALAQVAQSGASLLQFTNVSPARTELRAPHSLEISLLEAPSTRIELQRTPRLENDRIFLRATLTSTQTLTTEATFIVRQLGWHSTLAPSLNLTRPWGSAGTGTDFKFAPAVSWLHKYYPRRSETGPIASAARFTQLSGGLHITFLDHEPTKDTEIGVGLATSFWQDRLVGGFGWNLMNRSRPYMYIGSNLLPLLQTLGFESLGGAGKKP